MRRFRMVPQKTRWRTSRSDRTPLRRALYLDPIELEESNAAEREELAK